MSNVDELPDLTGDVAARVVPPPYDDVRRRLRARRRRGVAGGVAVVALVAGGLAVAQQLVEPTARPHHPVAAQERTPLPASDPRLWRAVVDGTGSHAFSWSGTDDGSLAVVWRALEPGAPTFALVVRQADGTVHGWRLDEPVDLVPVPGGWVGTYSSRSWLVTSDGTMTPLDVTAQTRDPRPGDVVVRGQYTSWLYSPGEADLSELASLDGTLFDGYVTPAGRLLTCGPVGDQIGVSTAGAGTSRGRGSSCVLVGHGDHVTAAGTGDGGGSDGGVYLLSLQHTHDGGTTWTDGRMPSDLDLTSVAVGADGTTYVTGTDGRLFVTLPDGSIAEPRGTHGNVTTTGDRVWSLPYGLNHGPLRYSDDHGTTWSETTLPGLR